MTDKSLVANQNLLFEKLSSSPVKTPAFIYDKAVIESNAQLLAELASKLPVKFTYSIKACAITEIIKLIEPYVSGFSASSVFEARLCQEIIKNNNNSIHITTPSLTIQEVNEIKISCDFVAFNSLNHAFTFTSMMSSNIECGLRINPNISYVADERYDPCRQHSKLGAPIDAVAEAWYEHPDRFNKISGLHFHTNSESVDFEALFQTVNVLYEKLPSLMNRIKWINMGGGYSFNQSSLEWLKRICNLFSKAQTIFMEPGDFLVSESGYLVSTVTDIFHNSGKHIAILDTSVNHLPECFEYQFSPDVINDHIDNDYEYILAGSSCLAGDIFGEYCFPEKLSIGDKVVFKNVGAYSLVKANTFNGLALPDVYLRRSDEACRLISSFTYNNYRTKWINHEAD